MKYIVRRKFFEDKIFGSIDDLRDYLESYEYYDEYDEAIDEAYPYADVCGYTYPASHVLKAVDPVAYQCDYNDWIDSQLADILYDVANRPHMSPFFFYGFEISCEEEEEEEEE